MNKIKFLIKLHVLIKIKATLFKSSITCDRSLHDKNEILFKLHVLTIANLFKGSTTYD